MVCLGNMCMATLRRGDNDDDNDDDDNNNNNNNLIYPRITQLLPHAAICYVCTRSNVASKSQIPEWRIPNDFKHKTDTPKCRESLHVLRITNNTFTPYPNTNVTSDHI